MTCWNHNFPTYSQNFTCFHPFPWHFPKAFARTTRPRPAHWSPWPSPLACRARGGTLVLGVFTHRGTIFLTKDGENMWFLAIKHEDFDFALVWWCLIQYCGSLLQVGDGWSFYNAMKHGEHVSFYIIYTLYINIITDFTVILPPNMVNRCEFTMKHWWFTHTLANEYQWIGEQTCGSWFLKMRSSPHLPFGYLT